MKKGDIVYICGINITKTGRINLNKPPFKGVVSDNNLSIKLEDNKYFSNYPGYEIFDNLEDCEAAYETMKKDAILLCNKQLTKFYNVIKILKK